MNIHDAVETMIEKDMTKGFAAGFFSYGVFTENHALKDAFRAHARTVAVESIALVLNLTFDDVWNQYQAQSKEAKKC